MYILLFTFCSNRLAKRMFFAEKKKKKNVFLHYEKNRHIRPSNNP